MHGKTKTDKHVIGYQLELRSDATTKVFTDEEKAILRPIAETIAMLDGNAFFTMDTDKGEWYEQYLPEAWSLFKANGGLDGWAGEASWIRDMADTTPIVVEARRNLRVALALSKSVY
jgi:hypothetical protein